MWCRLVIPGVVTHSRPISEPHNLACGWVGFDLKRLWDAGEVINDAAMQALGSYQKGQMLFLGLGTGLGSTMIVDGHVEPMELAHLPYKRGTYEDYVGLRGLRGMGRKKWERHVLDVVARLSAALGAQRHCAGRRQRQETERLPPGCRAGNNANAFLGGFRLWGDGVDHLPASFSVCNCSRSRQSRSKTCRSTARRKRVARRPRRQQKAKGEWNMAGRLKSLTRRPGMEGPGGPPQDHARHAFAAAVCG